MYMIITEEVESVRLRDQGKRIKGCLDISELQWIDSSGTIHQDREYGGQKSRFLRRMTWVLTDLTLSCLKIPKWRCPASSWMYQTGVYQSKRDRSECDQRFFLKLSLPQFERYLVQHEKVKAGWPITKKRWCGRNKGMGYWPANIYASLLPGTNQNTNISRVGLDD